MSISESDIEEGWLYRTPNNQERVVLAVDKEGDSVKYASRGGNVQNNYDVMQRSKLARFAGACSQKIKELPTDEFARIKKTFQDRGLV